MYKLRIDYEKFGFTKEDVHNIVQEISPNMFVLSWESGSKNHAHGLLKTDLKSQAIRKRFRDKRKIPAQPKERVISVVPTEEDTELPERYLTYILKEKEWLSHGISLEKLEEFEKNSYKKEEKLKQHQKIWRYLEQNVSGIDYYPNWRHGDSRVDIIRKIIDYHLKEGITFNKFKISKTFEFLACLKFEEYREMFARKISIDVD